MSVVAINATLQLDIYIYIYIYIYIFEIIGKKKKKILNFFFLEIWAEIYGKLYIWLPKLSKISILVFEISKKLVFYSL